MTIGETVYSRGYPTPNIYRQRGIPTFALEWTGDNLDPHVRDFIVLRCAEYLKNHIELFVTKEKSLIVYKGDRRPIVLSKGDFMVDQYQAREVNEMGWVIAEPERFWHLYEQIDPEPTDGV